MLVGATRGNSGQSSIHLILIKFEIFPFYTVFSHKIMCTIFELDIVLVIDPPF
jgi:hypothetical protein